MQTWYKSALFGMYSRSLHEPIIALIIHLLFARKHLLGGCYAVMVQQVDQGSLVTKYKGYYCLVSEYKKASIAMEPKKMYMKCYVI